MNEALVKAGVSYQAESIKKLYKEPKKLKQLIGLFKDWKQQETEQKYEYFISRFTAAGYEIKIIEHKQFLLDKTYYINNDKIATPPQTIEEFMLLLKNTDEQFSTLYWDEGVINSCFKAK